jgi:hypothetical protein
MGQRKLSHSPFFSSLFKRRLNSGGVFCSYIFNGFFLFPARRSLPFVSTL